MADKKKSGASKNRRLAGEYIYSSALPPEEESALKQISALFRPLIPKASSAKVGESAVRAIEPLVRQRFPQYPARDLAEALALAVLIPASLSDEAVDETHFLLGAALWFLDYAQERVLDDFYSLLPIEPDEELEYMMPMLDDLSHSHGTILRTMTILRHRKDKHNREFRQMLALLEKSDTKELRLAFMEKLLDYFGRYMEVRVRVKSVVDEKPIPSSTSILSKPHLPGVEPFEVTSAVPFPSLTPGSPFMNSFSEKWPEIEFLMDTPRLIGTTQECMRKSFHSKRMVNLLSGFRIENPYQLCAAYLLLEKENDVLVNLHTLTVAVKIATLQHLPWGYDEPHMWAQTSEDGTADYTMRYQYHPSEEGVDGLPISSASMDSMLSESQLFYLATCTPLPRGKVPSQRLTQWFIDQGISEGRAQELSFAAMMLSFQDDLSWEKKFEPQKFPDAELDEQDSDEGSVGKIDETLLAEQARRIKELRRALHETERNARLLDDKLREAEKRSAQDQDELHQLRNALFRIKAGEEPEDESPDSSITLPFRVERRVLILGGHDTWLKAIRTMIPGARFYEKETLPDLNAIRNADVLWIQPNAMSHEFYYRVLGVARKCGIPVRYFAYASARKCALQLGEDESSLLED